jgi:hypothetical protein
MDHTWEVVEVVEDLDQVVTDMDQVVILGGYRLWTKLLQLVTGG